MSKRWLSWLCLAVLAGWLGAGCASKSKALWNSRVGHYTFDQAVLDMGPPDKTAKLTDGTTVAEWMTMRGSSGRVVTSWYGYPSGVWLEPSAPDVFIRLTFVPDGKLKEWRKVIK